MLEPASDADLKAEILRLVREYARRRHAGFALPAPGQSNGLTPGVSAVPYAGRVFDTDEVEAGVASRRMTPSNYSKITLSTGC